MNKNFLGFGILFQAEDKGFIKSLDKSGKAALNLNDDLDKLDKTANGKDKSGKGGIFGKMKAGVDTFGVASLANFGMKLKDLMLGAGEDTIQFTHTIDNLQQRLGQVFDEKRAGQISASLKGVFKNFGVGAEQVDAIANSMLSFGRSADEISGVMPMIGRMVGQLGMNAEAVASMFGQGMGYLRASGDEMSNLVKETALFEKKWEIPGLIEQLPDLFAAAAGNAAQFGKVSSKSVMSTVGSMTALTAAYVKMGKGTREATTMAISFSGKLTSMKRSITDMAAGLDPLDDSMNQLIGVMGMMGKTGSESFDMIMRGADNPDAFRKQLSAMYSGLADDQKAIVGAHLRRVFGEDEVNAIVAYGGDLNKASAAAEKKGKKLGTASDEFEKLSGAMTNTLEHQKQLTANAQSYARAMTSLLEKENIVASLNNQRKAWLGIANEISNSDSALGFFLRKIGLLKESGLGGIFPGAEWMGFAAPVMFFVSSLITSLGMLTGAFEALGGAVRFFGKFIPAELIALPKVIKNIRSFSTLAAAMESGLIGLSKAFKKSLWLAAIGTMFYTIWQNWDRLQNAFSAGSLQEKFNAIRDVASEFIHNFAAVFDEMLLGIPSKLTQFAFGMDSFVELMDVWSKSVEAVFGDVFMMFGRFLEFFDKVPGIGKIKELLGIDIALATDIDPKNKLSGKEIYEYGSLDGDVYDPSVKDKTKNPASESGGASVIPMNKQEGAPSKSSMASSLKPSERPELTDVNFQSIVDAVLDTKDQLAKLLAMIVDKPTDVVLQGDAKKFLSLVNREQARSAAGSIGMNAAVGR